MAFLAGHHQVSLARHHAMLSVLPAQASLSSTVTFARGPREPCGERSWSRQLRSLRQQLRGGVRRRQSCEPPPRSQTPDATVASIRRETPYSSKRIDPPHVTKRPPAETARIAHRMPGSGARAMAGDTESPCPTRSSQHGPRPQGRPGPGSPSTGKPRGQLESPLGFGHHRQARESPPPATTPHPRRPLRLVRSCLAGQ